MEQTETVAKINWVYIFRLCLLYICALGLGARLIYLFLADPTRFPINHIHIQSTYEHISQEQFQTILSPYQEDSYFSFPVSKLTKKISENPWIKDVDVERVWPDSLNIVVTDKVPAATWNEFFLTADGDLFDADESFKYRPLLHLYGPINQQREVLQVYEKLSRILERKDLHVGRLNLRDNQAWELYLTNGVLIRLGKRDLEQRLSRFCNAYPTVFEGKRLQSIQVDLRYPRGMAVQWNQLAEK